MNMDKDDKIKVDYEFHNNAEFMQIELVLEEKDVKVLKGISQIRPTLQA